MEIAHGDGWRLIDAVCSSGPEDRPFEEVHAEHSVAVVLSGTFEYRSSMGAEVLTPGSLLLCAGGTAYECAHEHGRGDRCLAFKYTPEFFDDATQGARFRGVRIPPLRKLTPIVARVAAAISAESHADWDSLAVALLSHAVSESTSRRSNAPRNAIAEISRAVRLIDAHPEQPITLAALARRAALSPFHFLRTFKSVTGVTPHQYLIRARLRRAAVQLAKDPDRILDVAFDCGFGDVSNFNHAFRAEFGESPTAFQRLPTNASAPASTKVRRARPAAERTT